MARLWTCGFELQSTTANVEFTALTGTASISTTVHRAGAAALRSNPTAGSGYIEHQIDTAAAVKRTFHRFYLRVDTLPAAATAVYAIGQSGFFPCHLRLSPTGALQLWDSSLGAAVGTASTALVTGVWYRVEIDHQDAAAGTATAAAYLNGVQFGTGAVTVINGFSRIRAGVYTPTTTADIYVDDIAVNDTTGTAQTGLPGAGSVVHLSPSAMGDFNDFPTQVGGTAGAANNYTRVNETTPDDATSYNETSVPSVNSQFDDFHLPSAASAGIHAYDAVTLVAVGARIGSNATTTATLLYRVKTQLFGTPAESPSVSVAVNGWATHKAAAPFVHQLVSYTNPQTGGPWTPALVNSAQVGYRTNTSQSTVRRVSTLWLLVEFVPASGRLFETLTDDFDADTVDTDKWPDNYTEGGGPLPDQMGGRARVPCTPNFAAFASGSIYTLADTQLHVRAYPPAAGGATGSVFCQLLVLSSVAGTQIVFEIDVTTNLLLMAVHVDYHDENPGTLTYDPVEHAWLRVRENDGLLYWDTSPDGRTWTTRHTEMSPAWVADGDLQAQLLAYRDDGTDDYAYFDDLNITPALLDGYTVAVDWAGDGTFDGPYDDVTADVLARGPVTFQYGRDQDRQIAPPTVGSMTMTLCNADRIYSPENPDSPIVDDLRPAAAVKVETVLDDVLYPLFRARVDEFEVHPDRGNRSADITALSLLSLLQGVRISTELYAAQRTGTLVGIILDTIGWTGPRDLDLGASFVPWWWLEETDAFSALTDLLQSEGPPSIAYVSPDGTFIFRDRHHRLLRAASLTPQATFSADAAGECSPVYGYGTGGYGEGGYGGA